MKLYGVKSKHPQTLESKIQTPIKYRGKIQILKYQGVKSKHLQMIGDKIQILKLHPKSNEKKSFFFFLFFFFLRNKWEDI